MALRSLSWALGPARPERGGQAGLGGCLLWTVSTAVGGNEGPSETASGLDLAGQREQAGEEGEDMPSGFKTGT